MKTRSLVMRLAAALIVIALAACSGASRAVVPAEVPDTGLPALLASHTTHHGIKGVRCVGGKLPPRYLRKKPLVYVASALNPSCVLIYRSGLRVPVGQITANVSSPNGLFFDSKGDLYVANAQNLSSSSYTANTTVSMYPPNSLTPSVTYTGLTLPQGVAVDKNGTVYIADALGSYGGTGIVHEYPAGSTTPSTSFSLPGAYVMALVFDPSGNLLVSWWTQDTRQIQIWKYAPGSTTGTNLDLELPAQTVPGHTIAFDAKGNMVIPVETGLYQVTEPQYLAIFHPGSRKPHKMWLGSLANLVWGVAFPRNKPNEVYISGENSGVLLQLTYPQGLVLGSAPVGLPDGIAISQ